MTDSVVSLANLGHLDRLTGVHGLFEHSLHDEPRVELGYTTDDNARALVVACQVGEIGVAVDLAPYLRFVLAGPVANGWHNRMAASGVWDDRRGSDDCHGRAIWGVGTVIAHGFASEEATDALQAGIHSFDSRHPRALAYAALGATVMWRAEIGDATIEAFLDNARHRIPRPRSGSWRWPARRLTYDNARLPQAMIELGQATGDISLLDDGLALLDWLMEEERGSHGFSFTPVGGRGPGDEKPAFDQQPIEAWAMADACHAAMAADQDARWRRGVIEAAEWFLGRNDTGVQMYDRATGAGFDGLHRDGRNENRGAESTLSALGALARREMVDRKVEV